MRRHLLRGCVISGVVGLTGCVSSQLNAREKITQEYDSSDVSGVAIGVDNGEIDVHNKERERIRVKGRKLATDEESLGDIWLESERDGDLLELTFEDNFNERFLSVGERFRVDVTVCIPDPLSIDAENTNGDLEIKAGGPGDVTASTRNGNIDIALRGLVDVTVETTNGDIDVTLPATAEPDLSYKMTNGDVTVSSLKADCFKTESSIQTTIGDGTHRIVVRTTNSDLNVQRGS